jgi:N-methylhydantoinase A
LLEGEMPIRGDKARTAIADNVAKSLGMTAVEAAWGVLTVLVTNCVAAIRTITVERGHDPREFTLVPFGGMGPTIAGRIAAELGIERILVPRDPGTFSAWGMLVTDVRQERSLTRVTTLDDSHLDEIENLFHELEDQAIAGLARENFPRDKLSAIRDAGMRYKGQSYEVSVPVPPLASGNDIQALIDAFHKAHERRYGHKATDETIEIVNFRVTAIGAIPKPDLNAVPPVPSATPAPAPIERRDAWFDGARSQTPIYRRRDLLSGMALAGPAVIEEKTSTIVLYPGQTARVDPFLNLEIACAPSD